MVMVHDIDFMLETTCKHTWKIIDAEYAVSLRIVQTCAKISDTGYGGDSDERHATTKSRAVLATYCASQVVSPSAWHVATALRLDVLVVRTLEVPRGLVVRGHLRAHRKGGAGSAAMARTQRTRTQFHCEIENLRLASDHCGHLATFPDHGIF